MWKRNSGMRPCVTRMAKTFIWITIVVSVLQAVVVYGTTQCVDTEFCWSSFPCSPPNSPTTYARLALVCSSTCRTCPWTYVNVSKMVGENVTLVKELLAPGHIVRLLNDSGPGYVLRVFNTLIHYPPVLVAWQHLDYETSWVAFNEITLTNMTIDQSSRRSLCFIAGGNLADYKTYMENQALQIGISIHLRNATAGVWAGDSFIYLGKVGSSVRLWSYRRQEILILDITLEKFDPMKFEINARYEYQDEHGNLVGNYDYPEGYIHLDRADSPVLLSGRKVKVKKPSCISSDTYLTFDKERVQYGLNNNNPTLVVDSPGYRYFSARVGTFYIGHWFNYMEVASHLAQVYSSLPTSGYINVNQTVHIKVVLLSRPPVFLASIAPNFTSPNQLISRFSNSSYDITIKCSMLGLHKVYLMAWNQLSLRVTRLSMLVFKIFPIENLTLTVNNSLLVSSGASKSVSVTLTTLGGSDVHCTSNNLPTLDRRWVIPTSYSSLQDLNFNGTVDTPMTSTWLEILSPGKHVLTMTCSNALTFVSASVTVLVVVPITGLTLSLPSNSFLFGEPIQVSWKRDQGNFLTFELFYNDTSCGKCPPPHGNNLVQYTSTCSCIVQDLSFFTPNHSVIIKGNASNQISSQTKTSMIKLYQKIENVTITLTSTQPSLGLVPGGRGPSGDMYPLGHPVVFEGSFVNGPPSSIIWIVTCTHYGSFSRTKLTFEYQFNLVDTCHATLTMSTPVQNKQVTKIFQLQNSFVLDSVTTNGPVKINDTMTINIKLSSFGYGTCMWLDLGDNSTLYVAGTASEPCRGFFNISDINPNIVSNPRVNYITKSETARSIFIEHLYPEIASYTMKMHAADLFSKTNHEQVNVVVDLFCKNPNTTITGLSPNHSYPLSAAQHYRSLPLYLYTENQILCEKTEMTRTKWTVYQFDVDPRTSKLTVDYMPKTAYPLTASLEVDELHIYERTLTYGFYAITARLEMDGLPDIFGTDTFYVHIIQTPWLEPAITAGSFVTAVFSEQGILDASVTVDPDFEGTDGMSFTWFCKDVDDVDFYRSSMSDEALIYVPNVNDSDTWERPSGKLDNITGCFGTGRGRLNVTGSVLTLETIFMAEGQSFDVKLLVSKDHPEFGLREALLDIYFTVLVGQPPALVINCQKNCQKKLDPDQKMILDAKCVARCYGELEFTWTMFEYPNMDMKEPRNLSASSLTEIPRNQLSSMVKNPIRELSLAFKPNSLTPRKKYVLQLIAMRPFGVFGEARYTVKVNDVPSGGNCSIEPLVGIAMQTTFKTICSNWNDNDTPLKYEFFTVVEGVSTVYFYGQSSSGTVVSSQSWLPIGDYNNNYELEVKMIVKDRHSAGAERNFTIKVEPPVPETVNTTKLKNNLAEQLDELITSGDTQGALKVMSVVSSVLNHLSKPYDNTTNNTPAEDTVSGFRDEDELNAIRMIMLKALTNINAESTATFYQMSGVFASVTDVEDAPDGSQELTVRLAEYLTMVLHNLSSNDARFSDIEQGALNLAKIVGNAINSIPQFHTNSSNGTDTANLTLRCVNLASILQDILIQNMAPNEGPLTAQSSKLSCQIEKVTVKGLGSSPKTLDNAQLSIPTADVFGLGQILEDINATIAQLSTVDVKMAVFSSNPFTWDNTSKTVLSKVVSLELFSSQNMTTSNLTKEIAITIPRDSSNIRSNSFYLKPGKDDPNTYGSTFLKFHCFNRSSQWTAMSIEFEAEDASLNVTLYLKAGYNPGIENDDYDAVYKLPDFSTCSLEEKMVADNESTSNRSETVMIDPYKHCLVHPYSVFISNIDFNRTGKHCLAVEYVKDEDDDDRANSPNSRRKRSFSCDLGKRRVRRSCVIIPSPPPPPPTSSPLQVLVADNLGFDGNYFFPNQTPNYNLTMYESSCLYWDEENQTWAGHGCRVGPLTSRSSIQCFCNHLTSFGSDLIVAPNPIDFDSVFLNFGSLQDNVAVLALISTVLGVYIVGVIWARRADKRDLLMIGPTILPKPRGSYHYLITLYTGNRQGSGTTAKVFFKMNGDEDDTIPVKLWDPARPCFQRAQKNEFLVSYPGPVGQLSYVQLWHNNSGSSPSWYLSRLSVKDFQTDQQWYFVCDNWLAVESEDGKVCRILPVANDQELTNFNQMFMARAIKGLADGHLWFSIFSKPPNNRFTRVQRLSCCLCLLCCTMITSAMFYNMGGEGPSPYAVHIGSLVIDLKQFVIGLQSSIIIIPVNVALVQIFCNLRTRKKKGEKQNDDEAKKDGTAKENRKERSEETIPQGKLPHWFLYVAFSICYLTSAACIFFTLLYSIQWGKKTSTEWVIAMITAFFQSIVLLQPVKVVIMAVVFAVLIRKPCDSDEENSQAEECKPLAAKTAKKRRKKLKNIKIYRPPDRERLLKARLKRLKEIKMNAILKEIAAFYLFLIMLMSVAYYHRTPETYLMTKTLFETFQEVDAYGVDLAAASDADSFWIWARETLIPGLYATEWYNGKKLRKGYIANMENYLVGVPRVRLLRVEKDSCSVGKYFKDTIPHCYTSYSISNEETTSFNVGWEPLTSSASRKRRNVYGPVTEKEWLMLMATSKKGQGKFNNRQKRAVDPIMSANSGKNRRKKKRLLASASPKTYIIHDDALLPDGKIVSCLERWRHQTSLELRGFPYWGTITMYSGSGYAANLGYDPVTAYTVVSDLHSNGWIDVQTRAVFVEFTVYNANTNLFGILSALVEFPASSSVFTRVQYQVARFYLHLTFGQTLAHVMVIFFMLYFLYREARLVYKQRWNYFKDFWNWIETILVLCEFTTIILFLARLYEVDRNLLQLRENPNDYVGFQYAGSADTALCYVLGVLVFFYTLRFIRLLRFNKNFLIIGKILGRISGPILNFCLPFFFGFLAFGLFAFSVFGTELEDYSTFTMTLVTQFSMTLGDFDFEALVMVNPLLGPIYFFAFIGLNIFILMNMFLAIINDSYAEIQDEEQNTRNEYEVVDHVVDKLKTALKLKRNKVKVAPKRKKRKPKVKPCYVSFQESQIKSLSLEFENCEERLKRLLDVVEEGEKSEVMAEKVFVKVPKDKQHDSCFQIAVLIESICLSY